ncbi:hypothetical protein AAG570_008800 [Ranatra chinensis]|uniref:Uncharacterized protein n=1 Tax=Ranatra chinensis TaxID=642074 RepID=A0ABD0YRX5_9HEMI
MKFDGIYTEHSRISDIANLEDFKHRSRKNLKSPANFTNKTGDPTISAGDGVLRGVFCYQGSSARRREVPSPPRAPPNPVLVCELKFPAVDRDVKEKVSGVSLPMLEESSRHFCISLWELD